MSVLVLLLMNLCACGSSNHVVSNRLIQKRKYTGGWFVKPSKTQKQTARESDQEKRKDQEQVEIELAQLDRKAESNTEAIDVDLNKSAPISLEQDSRMVSIVETEIQPAIKQEPTIESNRMQPKIIRVETNENSEIRKKSSLLRRQNASNKKENKRVYGIYWETWVIVAIVSALIAIILGILANVFVASLHVMIPLAGFAIAAGAVTLGALFWGAMVGLWDLIFY